MTVAQYPPRRTGSCFLKATRPGLSAVARRAKEGRDDRQLLTLVKPHARDQEPNLSIVPSGTDISFASFPSPPRRILGFIYFQMSLRDRPSPHTTRP